MAHQLYQTLGCGKGGSICPPSKSQRLKMIALDMQSLPRTSNSIPRVKALYREASQLMKSSSPVERTPLRSSWTSIRGIFSDILNTVVGAIGEGLSDGFGNGGDDATEEGEDCYFDENGEEWCYY